MPVTVSRRVWMIGGAAAVVAALAVALVVVLEPGGDASGVRLSTPSYTADPVPKPRTPAEGDVSKRCGVSTATLHTYVPRADDLGHGDESGVVSCEWYSLNNGTRTCPALCPAGDGDSDRILEIGITKAEPDAIADGSPDGDALRALDPASAPLIAAGDPARPVGGLGDEALYHYSPGLSKSYTPRVNTDVSTGGALLRFRAGAVVVTVTYSGRDFSDSGPVRQVVEKQARPAVLAAATDIATALHAPAKPALTAPAAAALPPPAPRAVRPCELVPDDVVQRLAAGATRERPRDSVADSQPPYGQASDSCEWDAEPTCCLHEDSDHRPERHLTVTVYAESEWRRGIAVAQATRLYLEHHDDARAAAQSAFHAVRGLGDQAYAAYRKIRPVSDTSGGEVTFRYRDLVVVVGYRGADGSSAAEEDQHPLAEQTAVNGAYTAATAVLEALR